MNKNCETSSGDPGLLAQPPPRRMRSRQRRARQRDRNRPEGSGRSPGYFRLGKSCRGLDLCRIGHGRQRPEKIFGAKIEARCLRVVEQFAGVRMRNNAPGAALLSRIHPPVDARDVLASDGRSNIHAADFGDHSFRGLKMIFAHSSIFAIIAKFSQGIFAIIAIGKFANVANMVG